MKTVAILGKKGGTTKTASSHLLCLGAYLHGIPAAYVLTDPERKVRSEGRPYAVLDGRLPEQLALIFNSSQSNLNGWLVIDGGGNRPDFDKEIAKAADLTIIPFRASEEDVDSVGQSLTAIPNALAWPSAWPTNAFAVAAAKYLLDGMAQAFPQRVMSPAIPFVNSVSDLLSSSLVSPSSSVRHLARKSFATMNDYYEAHCPASPDLPAHGPGPTIITSGTSLKFSRLL
jgi:chromosome partitioning protein